MARLIGRLANDSDGLVHLIGRLYIVEILDWRPNGYLCMDRKSWDGADDMRRAAILSMFQVHEVGEPPLRCPACLKVVFDPLDCMENSSARMFVCAGCGCRWRQHHGLAGKGETITFDPRAATA